MTAAQSTVQIDDDRVRVTEWRFEPGAETGWHTHELDYVIVPLVSGSLQTQVAAETTSVDLRNGESYARPAGIKHNVTNTNQFEFAFIEIELKDPAS
ncbi:MAG: cupin domain-containing protein [Ilumatobacteraceae bacterium]